MEYKELTNSWHESVESGDIDEALKRIELQIVMNFMNIHNNYCSEKLESPLDVYVSSIFGKSVIDENKQLMAGFIEIYEEFIEAGHGLDVGSTCPKEYVLELFQNIENSLKKEIERV